MAIFGDPTGGGMPPGQAAASGMPTGAQMPRGNGMGKPTPSEAALANQVYQLQQMYIDVIRRLDAMATRPMQMQVTLHRDNDGKIAGMTATEGGRQNG